ncbi:MAG: response regulator [Planctomycetes bacterium]|nr:response regulator [Planctomycetota bacterium]
MTTPKVPQSNDASGDAPLSEKRIFTTGEAAELCKVSQQTIIRCFDNGRLNGFKVPGSKFRRIPREELIRFMRANDIPTEILTGPVLRNPATSEDRGTKRILIVDDDPAIVELFQDLLSRDTRLETRSASTGYDAGVQTEAFRPHLVLLDFMLPDINGNLVCSRLRANPALNGIRILCVSGVVDQTEIQSLRDAGADDFIKKPFDIHHLLGRVYELLGIEQASSVNA